MTKRPGADIAPLALQLSLPEALDQLIERSTATDKPEEVKTDQAERAKYPEVKPEGPK